MYDEDEAALSVMKTTLGASGARVSVARSLEDVLALVARERVDVVATDAMLARPRACALLIALRTSANQRVRHIRFVQLRCVS